MLGKNKLDNTHEISLSARELECIKWCSEGKTFWEIGKILGISERTVNFHIKLAKEKSHTVSIAHCVAVAIRANLI